MSTAKDQSQAPSQVCILWHAPAKEPSASLIRALSTRGLAVMPTSSPHTALAGACQAAKSAKRVVLVLDHRELLAELDRVLLALDRFAPSVICWEHRHDANPPMVPLVRFTEPEDDAEIPSHGPAKHRAEQPLRLVGETQGQQEELRSKIPTAKITPLSARDVLDADELDALLAGEMSEGRRGK
jgi:hypothetical protein